MRYCTLFDSNYLDRGLVLIESLERVDKDSKIYVLCMDDICADILQKEGRKGVVTITLEKFENEALLKIKRNRSWGEYCWTCTAMLIKHVIIVFHEEICTYVDADMKFYSNPEVLIHEMDGNDCVVQTVPHRFAPGRRRVEREKESGKNCVQFNTFTNNADSLKILDAWIESCLNNCSIENSGDQKYTDVWSENRHVNISCNIGAGVAPWNINRYRLLDETKWMISDKYLKKSDKLIFYHFQNLVFPDERTARVIPYLEYWRIDKKLVTVLYVDYLHDLYKMNKYVFEMYGHRCMITRYISETDQGNRRVTERVQKWMEKPIRKKMESIDRRVRIQLRRNEAMFQFH